MRTAGRSSSPEPSQPWQAYLGRMVRITRSCGRNHVQLLAGFLPDAHQLGAAQAVLLLFGDVDDDLFTGESFGKGPPLGPPACVLGDTDQRLLALVAWACLRRGLRLVEEPQLPLVLFTEGFAAAAEEPLLQPGDLLVENVHALCQLSARVSQLGVLLP